jgi:hypothetical protein
MTGPEEMRDVVPIAGLVRLTPDPRSLEALGRNHTLEAALAELVDNSIDAGARNVLIRFVRAGGRLVRLLVADDGAGMDDGRIDVAMTVGGNRDYADAEIGRFGLGLKAASFSQARSVTVVSSAEGSDATGRRWQAMNAKRDYQCEIVEPSFAGDQLTQDWGFSTVRRGTLVRWDDVKGFPAVDDEGTIDRFLQGTIARIRTHLGLIFHRILDAADVRLVIDVEDGGEVILHSEVPSLDPFDYPRTGAAGWPKQLVAEGERERLLLECHIWPGRSTVDQFRLDGDMVQRQGLYVYYNERLVQCGGWNGLHHADKQLSLARVAVSIEGDVEQMVSLKPEKNGVEVGPDFGPAVYAAVASDGTTFGGYIERARGVLKDANRRRRVRQAVIPPGAGLPPNVRRAFARELEFKDGDPVDIRWADFGDDDFFEVDREQGVLWLNSRYRRALAGGRNGSLNDLPVVKALMFLLVENIYAGQNMGPRDKDNIEIWQAILTAAARAERR